MYKLVLIRHGESQWNKENRFTGWTDVNLSEQGENEAIEAGNVLKNNNYFFDYAYTSVLTRAIKTLNIILEELDCLWIPTEKAWQLNERHYGALQGLNKDETAKKYGEKQVHVWRRSYNIRPPELSKQDERHEANDKRYFEKVNVPLAESLEDTVSRVVPYWDSQIAPMVKSGKKIIISAHGNSLRGLIKHIENISDDDIIDLNIQTGKPIVYVFDNNLLYKEKFYI